MLSQTLHVIVEEVVRHQEVHTLHIRTQASSIQYVHLQVDQLVTVHQVHQQVLHVALMPVYMHQDRIQHSLLQFHHLHQV